MNAAVRRGLPVAALVVVLIVATVLIASPRREGPPLDPRSHSADGTAGILDVARELGAEVSIGSTDPMDDGIALLLVDDLSDDQRAAVRAFVRQGGTLVVTDPASELTPEIAGTTALGFLDPSLPRGCDVPALADVDRVSAPGSFLYDVEDGCFSREEGSWLAITEQGEGTIVALGGPGAFTNGRLREADNGLLAATLLAPEPGTELTVLEPAPPGSGDQTLMDLVPRGVVLAVLQLGVVFLAVALWRGRRLGRPVDEPQQVAVPGSELVVAVGNLYQQTSARARAAAALRGDLRRALGERLGLPPSLPDEALADAVAQRTGTDRARVLAALAGPPPADEAALVRLSQELSALRRAVLTQDSRDLAARPPLQGAAQ